MKQKTKKEQEAPKMTLIQKVAAELNESLSMNPPFPLDDPNLEKEIDEFLNHKDERQRPQAAEIASLSKDVQAYINGHTRPVPVSEQGAKTVKKPKKEAVTKSPAIRGARSDEELFGESASVVTTIMMVLVDAYPSVPSVKEIQAELERRGRTGGSKNTISVLRFDIPKVLRYVKFSGKDLGGK